MITVYQSKPKPGAPVLSGETRWIGLALDLLRLCEQTDEVLRQRAALMAELLVLSEKGPRS